MARVRVLGPRTLLPAVLEVLQDVGTLHLGPAVPRAHLETFIGPATLARRRRHLLRVLGDVEAVVGEPGTDTPTPPRTTKPGTSEFARWARLARRSRHELADLDAQVAALEDERALLSRYHGFYTAFEALLPKAGVTPSTRAFHVVLRAEQSGALPQLQQALSGAIGQAFEVLSQPLASGETALLLLVPASAAPKVEQLLSATRVHDIPVPSGYGTSLQEAVPRMREREAALPQELDAVRTRREALLRGVAAELEQARLTVRDALAVLEAMRSSAVTDHAFVLEGWIPIAVEGRLSRALDQAFGTEVVVELIGREHWHGEEAPVVLRNPRLFRPFEILTEMLPLPHYGTIDPTPYVAVFFPMFFGLIVGDAGYGAAMALLAFVLHRRSRPGTTLRAIAEIAGACALFVIAFGVLFGEYFGDLGRRVLGLRPLWLDREDGIIPFLGLTLALGLVHIFLGLVLGVIGARRHPREAAGRGLSALMLVLVVVALLAAMKVLPHALLTPAAIALLVAFPVLVALEGIVAPVEFLATLGHVLSYARIMALGVASVMLAVVANRMTGAFGSVIVGAVFALLFHLVNFALGLFSPTIHALRLHYVEFFGTFYSPGGVRYQPLTHASPQSGSP